MILGEKDCADSPFRRLTGREYRCPRAAAEGKTRLVCGVIGSGGQTAVNSTCFPMSRADFESAILSELRWYVNEKTGEYYLGPVYISASTIAS